MIAIQAAPASLTGRISLPVSKSIYNRVLVIRELEGQGFAIQNTPEAEDSGNLLKNISKLRRDRAEQEIDVGPAGTNMRFLTAFLSVKKGNTILKGSERMHKRPIGILVDALRSLGADIEYLGNEGFPPLRIKTSEMQGGKVSIASGVSSQYISALMLIGPVLPKGLELALVGDPVSLPYIRMTRKIMEACGALVEWKGERIKIEPTGYRRTEDFVVEADWSAASYWYAMAALAQKSDLMLDGLHRMSIQGDSVLQEWFINFGVISEWQEDGLHIHKKDIPSMKFFSQDFTGSPDLAQTFIALLAGRGIPASLIGFKTLEIKETNRIEAMTAEMARFGVILQYKKDHLQIPVSKVRCPNEILCTYKDHRMAMALAVLSIVCAPLRIDDEKVVAKSYPRFWEDLESVGFVLRRKEHE